MDIQFDAKKKAPEEVLSTIATSPLRVQEAFLMRVQQIAISCQTQEPIALLQ